MTWKWKGKKTGGTSTKFMPSLRGLLCLAVLAGSCVAYVPVQVSCFEDPSQASCR